MFTSKFIPVKVKSANETAVYSAGKIFPAKLLDQAHAFATGTGDDGNNVVIKEGVYTFKTNPEYLWTLADIVQAYNCLKVARDNDFSFYVVFNQRKIPNLFISSRFDTCRILVDAFTYRSVVVTDQTLVRKLSSMIGNSYEDSYLYKLFDMVAAKESGRNRYLDGVICNRYSSEPYLVVNPLLDVNIENGPWYGFDYIEEFRSIVYDQVTETESFIVEGNAIVRKNVSALTPLSIPYACTIVNLCDRLLEKKTDYIPLCRVEDYEEYLYLSTNYKYLVRADTLECATIKNINLRDWILSYAQQDYIPKDIMDTMWKLVDVLTENE